MKKKARSGALIFLLVLCIILSSCDEKNINNAITANQSAAVTETAADPGDATTFTGITDAGAGTGTGTSLDTGGATESDADPATEPVTCPVSVPSTDMPATDPVTDPGTTAPLTVPGTSVPVTMITPATSVVTVVPITETGPGTSAPSTQPPVTAVTSVVTSTVATAVTTTVTAKATSAAVTEPIIVDPAVKVSKITLSAPSSTLCVGKTLQITASVAPENADDKSLTWSVSSGSSYAKVDQNGVVTGVKAGKCTVKATANDGSKKYATISLSVAEASVLEGNGTKNSPYLVGSAEDLANLSKFVSKSGLYFKQTADIDLSGSVWTPIGNYGKPFRNNYDGAGFVISGLTLTDGDDPVGLFSVTRGAAFSNITITGLSTAGERFGNIGGIAGAANSSIFTNCRVEGYIETSGYAGMIAGSLTGVSQNVQYLKNCSASGGIKGGSYVGGLIGTSGIDSEVEDYDYDQAGLGVYGCFADVDIIDGCGYLGGLFGVYYGGIMELCRAGGNITASNGKNRGGLIGEVEEAGEISRCFATGSIKTTGTGYGDAFCGGLIGSMKSRCALHDCYAVGNIECASTWSDCQDSTTYNGGIFTGYRNPCGALVAMLKVVGPYESEMIRVYNCYATGTVTFNAPDDDLVYCKGSLIGLLYDAATIKLIRDGDRVPSTRDFKDAYYKDITEDMLTGTMIKRLENNYCVSDFRETYTPCNYIVRSKLGNQYVGQYKSLPSFKVVTNIDREALSDQATFSGFDFSNIWKMGQNGPELR